MKTGIILPNLQSSQLSYCAISGINKYIANNYNADITIFFERIVEPCVKPLCSIMCVNELFHFHGLLITCNLATTKLAQKLPTKVQNIFYVNDLEWLRQQQDFVENVNIYRSSVLVARSKSHADALSNYCNKNISYIMPNFSIESLHKVQQHAFRT